MINDDNKTHRPGNEGAPVLLTCSFPELIPWQETPDRVCVCLFMATTRGEVCYRNRSEAEAASTGERARTAPPRSTGSRVENQNNDASTKVQSR